MTFLRKALGARGEDAAARHLARKGFRILNRNWTCGEGELDLVARKNGLLVFCEVKTRTAGGETAPERSVGARKQAKIVSLARKYVREAGLGATDIRYDIISVRMDGGKVVSLEHFEGAFRAGRR